MIVKLLTEQHLELLSLIGGCRGSSESTHFIISNCWKSHAAAHLVNVLRKRDKISRFRNKFYDFNTTGTRTLDSVYQMTLK